MRSPSERDRRQGDRGRSRHPPRSIPGNLPDMRRLITSRGLWLALLAAIAAAAIVVIARSRRRPVQRASDSISIPLRSEKAQWPPAPILGTPTAEDLQRYGAGKPSLFDRPTFTKFFERGEPRQPLDAATRRRLTRWGVAGFAILMLALGTQVLESAVFSEPSSEVTWGPCLESPSDSGTACTFAGNEEEHGSDADYVSQQSAESEETQARPDADCRPVGAEPRVRKINMKVKRAVDRQWQRIEGWLKTNAPRSYRTLGKHGDAKTIAAAEAYMGMRFPDSLRASLLRHDGAVYLKDTWAFGFLGNSNLSVREMREMWRQLCDIDGEEESDGGFSDPRSEWWDGRMIPVGADGMGDHLVIDSARKDIGGTDHEGTMDFTPGGVRIRSFYALLKTTADAMEKGGSIGYWKPKVVDGELDWDVL
ncbi:SMI1/KNR4 family protein [Nonomuraea sp. CA-143628]|uniref:SMI1/KNR4 family protein n=1 Tax=Nonomuraea sp. CA-143628 TaxID=3239997 RepID=UPI003D8FB6C9